MKAAADYDATPEGSPEEQTASDAWVRADTELADPTPEVHRVTESDAQVTGAVNMNSSIIGFMAMSTSSMRTPSGSRWYANCVGAVSPS